MLDYLCSVSPGLLCIFVVISSGFFYFCFLSTSPEIGSEEHLQNDVLLCGVGCKTLTQSISVNKSIKHLFLILELSAE